MLFASRKIFLFSILLLYFLGITPAFAQQIPFNLTVTPQFFDLSSSPAKTLTEKVRIRNNNDSITTYTISIKKMTVDENGSISLRDFQTGETEAQWIQINTASIAARPKEWTDIPFTISIPKDASFEHDLALFISGTTAKKQGNSAQITGSVVIPMLIAVQKEGIKISGKLESFITDSQLYEYLPVTFSTIFQNTGNIHVQPRGNIFITDWTGKQIATLDINAGRGNILPHAKRTFTSIWDDSFITYENKTEDGRTVTDKNGKPQKELKIHFDRLLNFRIGKYTATALVVVSGDKRDYSYEQSTTFFVFPWKIVLGLVVVIILAVIGLSSIIKSLVRGIKRLFNKHEKR